MVKAKTKIFRRLSLVIAFVMTIVCFRGTPVLAAGIETLPLGWHTISSSFTINHHNYSPLKTCAGQYLTLRLEPSTTSSTPLAVITKIRNYDTGAFIDGATDTFLISNNTQLTRTPTFNLGNVRRIQIYTEVRNAITYELVDQSVTFTNYRSYVSNTAP